jgi:hypothetical protein
MRVTISIPWILVAGWLLYSFQCISAFSQVEKIPDDCFFCSDPEGNIWFSAQGGAIEVSIYKIEKKTGRIRIIIPDTDNPDQIDLLSFVKGVFYISGNQEMI